MNGKPSPCHHGLNFEERSKQDKEKTMDLQHAQAEKVAGNLHEVVVEPSPHGNGWMVVFIDDDGERHLLTDHTGTEKIYHTLDHASEAAREAGFETVRVEETF